MARNEKLIVRHPEPKVEDDRYMLDRWTPAVTHKTRHVYRDVMQGTPPREYRWYRVECLCGWRTAEMPRIVAAECPVLAALTERARNLKRDGERIEWKAVE
jgi:hypothetical protein